MLDWGDTYLGSVTGNNSYFTLTPAEAAKLKLGAEDLVKISPPGGRHLKGLTFSEKAWDQIAKQGGRCYLFAPCRKNLSDSASAYIQTGVTQEVHTAYKCTMRSPWWRVPQVPRPDILFTYMNHHCPRLVTNEANVQILNSLYGTQLKESVRDLGKAALPIACLNSVTLLGSEVVGRAYGGGLLKHEPKEADVLPIPSAAMLAEVAKELKFLKPQLATALRANDITAAAELVDEVLLVKSLKLEKSQLQGLRQAREVLFKRRMARAKTRRGEN